MYEKQYLIITDHYCRNVNELVLKMRLFGNRLRRIFPLVKENANYSFVMVLQVANHPKDALYMSVPVRTVM